MATRNKENVLVIATVASTIDQFCMKDIELLKEKYNVHVAANFLKGNNTSLERVTQFKKELSQKDIEYHHITLSRNPLDIQNMKASIQLNQLIKKYRYKIVHCHTPVAAMVSRLVASKYRDLGLKIIYTAHGFHFFSGAPIKNWILYYPIELYLSRLTDVLITINQEDYNRALKKFKSKRIEYIPGIGIELGGIEERIKLSNNEKILNDLNIIKDNFVILSVGELNKNKNHEVIIRAIGKLKNPNIIYLICGQGNLYDDLQELINELNLQNQVKLLGFRKDIIEICNISNLFVFPSYREGLSVALMEAMATGLPIICSNIRGNKDLIIDKQGGFLVEPNDIEDIANKIEYLIENPKIMDDFRVTNTEVIRNFSRERISERMTEIY